MKNPLSKTQIDRLGDRLKKGSHTEEDLRLLDDYRLSFGEAYETVVQKILEHGEFPTGRKGKTRDSIVAKLSRESIRLSQMQDISGCRIVVADIVQQELFVASLKALFPKASIIDRRDKPSYGYRAVHVIAQVSGKPIEIQVRSFLQHLWAQISEKSSDVLDPAIKYGGGSDQWRGLLTSSSEIVAAHEKVEKAVAELERLEKIITELKKLQEEEEKTAAELVKLEKILAEEEKAVVGLSDHHESNHNEREMQGELEGVREERPEAQGKLEEKRRTLVCQRNEIAEILNRMSSWLDKERLKGQKQ